MGWHTLQGLLTSIWEKAIRRELSRFPSVGPWSPAEVAPTWQTDFGQEVAEAVQAEHRRQRAERPKRRERPEATVVIGFFPMDNLPSPKPNTRSYLFDISG